MLLLQILLITNSDCFLAWLCLWFTHAYTVRSSGNIAFPTQKIEPTDSNSFLRTSNSNTELLQCPTGFLFNTNEMKCVSTKSIFAKKINYLIRSSDDVCPPNFRGTLPDPLNCRSFYNCWDGVGYETPCNEHLLYNQRILGCDWPESADCCEYWEKNSTLIVKFS